LEPLREASVLTADAAGRETFAPQCVGDVGDPAGADPLQIRFPECLLQRRLHAPVALEDAGTEAALPIARDRDLQLAHAALQPSRVAAVAIAPSCLRALARHGAQMGGDFGVEDLFQHCLHRTPDLLLNPAPVILGSEEMRP
jgi:hypothetical protein